MFLNFISIVPLSDSGSPLQRLLLLAFIQQCIFAQIYRLSNDTQKSEPDKNNTINWTYEQYFEQLKKNTFFYLLYNMIYATTLQIAFRSKKEAKNDSGA